MFLRRTQRYDSEVFHESLKGLATEIQNRPILAHYMKYTERVSLRVMGVKDRDAA